MIKLNQSYFSYISEDEKQMIFKATGLSGGHWFQCPNGHSYAIGECGGAMEESKCPECGAKIGGQSHTLTQSNRQSSLMAGNARPTWDPTYMQGDMDLARRL